MSAVDRWASTPVRWATTAAGIGIVMTLVAAPHATGYAAAAGVALVVLVLGVQRFIREQQGGQTDPAADPLTAQEARDLVDDLGLQLYRAEDAIAFVGECCDIADREQQPVTTARVREWLKGAQCARQAGLVLHPDASGQDPDPIRTAPDTTGQQATDQGGHDPDSVRTRLASIFGLDPATSWDGLLDRAADVDRIAQALAPAQAQAAALQQQLDAANTDTAVRGVQTWMTYDLHRALGRSTNALPECQHQGFKSWADWWADLIAQARNGHATAVARGLMPPGWYCSHCGRGDAAPTADNWAEEFQRAEAAEAALVLARQAHLRLTAYLAGFADVLDASDRGPWANTAGAALADLERALAEPTDGSSQ